MLTFDKLCIAVIAQKTAAFDITAKCGSQIHKGNECDPSAKCVKEALSRAATSLYCSPGKRVLNLTVSGKRLSADNAGRLNSIT